MIKKSIIVPVLCALLALSCAKDEWIRNPEGFEAEIVLLGGQCGGLKHIIINQSLTRTSVPKNGCRVAQAEIVVSTDPVIFRKLNDFVRNLRLNSNAIQDCARCSDGADYYIGLKNGSNKIEHYIALDTKNPEHKRFVDFLNTL